MELIKIDEVTWLSSGSDHVAGASVEVPVPGSAREEWWVAISGWVVGRSEPVTTIDVVQQDVRVASAPVEIVREDVADAHTGLPGAERAGFNMRIGGAWLPENFTLRLEAGFANGHRVPLALIAGRRAPLQAAPAEGALAPISVTALPRSGATLVMQMLAAHPEVVVAGAYPYSARPASYWMQLLRVLSAPADLRHSAHPDTFDRDLNWVGSHPFNGPPLTDAPDVGGWFGREYVSRLTEFATGSANELYACIAASRGMSGPRFYAEKQDPGAIARLTAAVHPCGREILVVRDFRDMACSMLAFAETAPRPGSPGGEELIPSLVSALARLVAYAQERGTATLVVRYEDLIERPADTLEQILAHAELRRDRRLLRTIVGQSTADTPQLAAHRTSPTAAASVGRYIQDMDGELLALAEESFGPALVAFGYTSAPSLAMA